MKQQSQKDKDRSVGSPARSITGLLALTLAIAAGCAVGASGRAGSGAAGAAGAQPAGPSDAEIAKLMKESFQAKGLAKLDRLEQSELQAACSTYATTAMPAELKSRLEKAALDAVRYPADNQYLGDFKSG